MSSLVSGAGYALHNSPSENGVSRRPAYWILFWNGRIHWGSPVPCPRRAKRRWISGGQSVDSSRHTGRRRSSLRFPDPDRTSDPMDRAWARVRYLRLHHPSRPSPLEGPDSKSETGGARMVVCPEPSTAEFGRLHPSSHDYHHPSTPTAPPSRVSEVGPPTRGRREPVAPERKPVAKVVTVTWAGAHGRAISGPDLGRACDRHEIKRAGEIQSMSQCRTSRAVLRLGSAGHRRRGRVLRAVDS